MYGLFNETFHCDTNRVITLKYALSIKRHAASI